ncbi:hypothetical protein JCM19232_5958 [Vibrio ishigakensis]|nr:hypothetical protein JCM19232_5958 [Vibrio ishigakensis]
MFNGMSAFVNLDTDSEAWYLSTYRNIHLISQMSITNSDGEK